MMTGASVPHELSFNKAVNFGRVSFTPEAISLTTNTTDILEI